MANFDNGVSGYIRARTTVEVNFPIDWRGNPDVSCNQCPFFRRSYRVCGLNQEICAFPEHRVGQCCPLEEVKEEWAFQY